MTQGRHRAVISKLAAAGDSQTKAFAYPTRTVAACPMEAPWQTDWRRLSLCPTWAGRPLSRWVRYGRYNEDGTLTVTRIMP